jgi:hypothetical protein
VVTGLIWECLVGGAAGDLFIPAPSAASPRFAAIGGFPCDCEAMPPTNLCPVLARVGCSEEQGSPSLPPSKRERVNRTLSFRSGAKYMSSASLKELVEYLAKALVDNPDDVEVSEVAGEQTVVLELRVAKEDLGKVIGKQGRTVKAMRAILSAASSKLRKRADLEILE